MACEFSILLTPKSELSLSSLNKIYYLIFFTIGYAKLFECVIYKVLNLLQIICHSLCSLSTIYIVFFSVKINKGKPDYSGVPRLEGPYNSMSITIELSIAKPKRRMVNRRGSSITSHDRKRCTLHLLQEIIEPCNPPSSP